MDCKQDKINPSGCPRGMKCGAVGHGEKALGLSHRLEKMMHCNSQVVCAASEI